LDILKKLLLKYTNALAESRYYKQLSEELKKKAVECEEQSRKKEHHAQELLQFIVSKILEHKKAVDTKRNNSLEEAKAASDNSEYHPNLENFIANIAANLKNKENLKNH